MEVKDFVNYENHPVQDVQGFFDKAVESVENRKGGNRYMKIKKQDVINHAVNLLANRPDFEAVRQQYDDRIIVEQLVEHGTERYYNNKELEAEISEWLDWTINCYFNGHAMFFPDSPLKPDPKQMIHQVRFRLADWKGFRDKVMIPHMGSVDG